MKPKTEKQRKGFRCMSALNQLRICTMGGKAVSQNRRHMARIGRLGAASKAKAARAQKRKNKPVHVTK